MNPVPPRGDTSGRTRRTSLEQPRSRRNRAALVDAADRAIGHRTLHHTFARAFDHGRDRGEVGDEHDPDELGGLLEWTLLRAELEWATSTSRQPALLKRLWGWVEIILRGTKAT
ncbi:MAG: hypothetical protein U5K29_11445 [Acidimicrobiales bacterium]|nr:hypothetical protein [Acidimicrobiales bacterium]